MGVKERENQANGTRTTCVVWHASPFLFRYRWIWWDTTTSPSPSTSTNTTYLLSFIYIHIYQTSIKGIAAKVSAFPLCLACYRGVRIPLTSQKLTLDANEVISTQYWRSCLVLMIVMMRGWCWLLGYRLLYLSLYYTFFI